MIHDPDCTCDAYGCRLRRKGVQLGPGQARTGPYKGRPESQFKYNGTNRGVAGERRPGGTFMPYLDAKGDTIPIREGRALAAKHREIRRAQHDRAVSAGHHH